MRDSCRITPKGADALTRQDLVLADTNGTVVNPSNIDVSEFSKDKFPYSLRQTPRGADAPRKVKFMSAADRNPELTPK